MNQTCDRCGPAVRAAYRVARAGPCTCAGPAQVATGQRCPRKAGTSGLLAGIRSHRRSVRPLETLHGKCSHLDAHQKQPDSSGPWPPKRPAARLLFSAWAADQAVLPGPPHVSRR